MTWSLSLEWFALNLSLTLVFFPHNRTYHTCLWDPSKVTSHWSSIRVFYLNDFSWFVYRSRPSMWCVASSHRCLNTPERGLSAQKSDRISQAQHWEAFDIDKKNVTDKIKMRMRSRRVFVSLFESCSSWTTSTISSFFSQFFVCVIKMNKIWKDKF